MGLLLIFVIVQFPDESRLLVDPGLQLRAPLSQLTQLPTTRHCLLSQLMDITDLMTDTYMYMPPHLLPLFPLPPSSPPPPLSPPSLLTSFFCLSSLASLSVNRFLTSLRAFSDSSNSPFLVSRSYTHNTCTYIKLSILINAQRMGISHLLTFSIFVSFSKSCLCSCCAFTTS